MLIFNHSGLITRQDDKTNIPLKFNVPEGVKTLKIEYSYSPKTVEDEALATKEAQEALMKYNVKFNEDELFPVKNLVTLSFDEGMDYRGACHRQPDKQTIIISEKNSTPGIINRPVKSGEWTAMLNVHFAGCEIKYDISIEGTDYELSSL